MVVYRVGASRYALVTTLSDPDRYSLADLSDLYPGRWGIEELCKTSKDMIAVDAFHGRRERGVRRELHAHFNLVAMTRLYSNHGDDLQEAARHKVGRKPRQTNFKNGLAMLAANLEELILARTAALTETVAWMAARILAMRWRSRPGRSCPRKSMKPAGKWSCKRGTVA